jgi:hypothetical protein
MTTFIASFSFPAFKTCPRRDSSDELLQRQTGLLSLFFLHLANTPPKQEVLAMRNFDGRIAGKSLIDRLMSLCEPLQT